MKNARSLARACALFALAVVTLFPASSRSTASAACFYDDTQGSYTLFVNSPTPVTVDWYYTSSLDELSVTVKLKGSTIGGGILKSTSPTLPVTGTVSGDTATVNLAANFSTHKLGNSTSVSGVNGNKNQANTGDF